MNRPSDNQQILKIIAHLTSAVKNTRLYSDSHPQVVQTVKTAYDELRGLLKTVHDITVFFVNNDVIVNGRPLPEDVPFLGAFIKMLKGKGIERVTVLSGITQNEFHCFIQKIASTDSTPASSTPHIKLGKVSVRAAGPPQPEETVYLTEEEQACVEKLCQLRDSEITKIQEISHKIKQQKHISVSSVDSTVKTFINSFLSNVNPINHLATIKSANEYTFTHVVNVCILTMAQAESMGFTGKHLYDIGVAAMLHDVGKLSIPEEILDKPGKLSEDERAIIETHTIKGARYLMGLTDIPKVAILAALEHHLKYDGSGYPPIRIDWRQNIVSQMIAVADVFDALRSKRAYNEPKPTPVIIKILKEERGSTFHPKILDHFLYLLSSTGIPVT